MTVTEFDECGFISPVNFFVEGDSRKQLQGMVRMRAAGLRHRFSVPWTSIYQSKFIQIMRELIAADQRLAQFSLLVHRDKLYAVFSNRQDLVAFNILWMSS